MELYILDIIESTIVDGPGMRTTIYAAGCNHHCKKCHNPQSWSIDNGVKLPINEILDKILSNNENVTFSGGDPLFQLSGFSKLAKLIKENSNKTIWCYTGFTYEQVLTLPNSIELLKYIDVMVDGPFIDSLKDESLLFRGSSNQRIIDVKTSLSTGFTTIYNLSPYHSPLLYKITNNNISII